MGWPFSYHSHIHLDYPVRNQLMATLYLFNKPFQVMCQFTDEGERQTLAHYIDVPDIYPAGRLDYDSEGLLALTDCGPLQHAIANPHNKMAKTYWVQVEGDIPTEAINALRQGVTLKDGPTLPAQVSRIEPPNLWERIPPVRFRANIPTSWLEITIKEGRNRQVRRMTAAVGYPTLRLVRAAIGEWKLEDLLPGQLKCLEVSAPAGSTTKNQRQPPKYRTATGHSGKQSHESSKRSSTYHRSHRR